MRASGRQWSAALVKFVQFVKFVVVFFCPLAYAAIPFVGIAQICLIGQLSVALGLSAFLRRDSA